MSINTESKTSAIQRLLPFRQRICAPVVRRLQMVMTNGLTPQKLALTLCIGGALGTMPLLWGTSILCMVLAYLFRLNQVALQSVNYLLYPLQLALLVPFFKLGAQLFPWGPTVPVNIFTSLLKNPGLSSVNILSWIVLKSLAAWLVTVLPLATLAYGILRTVTTKKALRTSRY